MKDNTRLSSCLLLLYVSKYLKKKNHFFFHQYYLKVQTECQSVTISEFPSKKTKKKRTIPGKRSSFLGVTHSVPPVTSDPEPDTSCAFSYFKQSHVSHCTHFLLPPFKHMRRAWRVAFKHQTWTPASNSDVDYWAELGLCVCALTIIGLKNRV